LLEIAALVVSLGLAEGLAWFALSLGITGVPQPAATSIRALMDGGEMPETAFSALENVRRIDELVRDHGGRLLVFYIPTPYMVGEYSRAWRPLGHAEAARLIADHMRDHPELLRAGAN